jgi:hypothetical protein
MTKFENLSSRWSSLLEREWAREGKGKGRSAKRTKVVLGCIWNWNVKSALILGIDWESRERDGSIFLDSWDFLEEEERVEVFWIADGDLAVARGDWEIDEKEKCLRLLEAEVGLGDGEEDGEEEGEGEGEGEGEEEWDLDERVLESETFRLLDRLWDWITEEWGAEKDLLERAEEILGSMIGMGLGREWGEDG